MTRQPLAQAATAAGQGTTPAGGVAGVVARSGSGGGEPAAAMGASLPASH